MKQTLKKFGKEIQISISVDAIAEKLLDTLQVDYKHRTQVAETILGSLLEDSTRLGMLYNSLNGFSNDINFEVGDEILCSEETRLGTVNTDGDYESIYGKIDIAKVIEVNPYADKKIKIEYLTVNRDLTERTETKWVSHINCEKIAQEELIFEPTPAH